MKMHSKLKLAAAPIAIGAALVAQPAFAQDGDTEVTSANENVEAAPIVVTGSRIERVNVDGPSPVQVFDEELIEARGAANIQDFLFQSNLAGPGIFSEAATLSQSSGSAFFDGRGFGTGYTLILLNGRRLPATPITGEQGTDLNMLPLAAVSRVEYLSDGASAIYGSDAISGVINIITKRDFDGLSLGGRVGIADEGDGMQYRVSGVWGTTMDRGSALLTAEYFHQDAIEAIDRPYIRSANGPAELGDAGGDGRSPTGYPGSWISGDFTEAQPFPGCPAESIRPSSFADSGTECAYDFAPLYQVNPETDRLSMSGFAEYDVTDSLNLYLDTRYSRSLTKVRNGAAPAFFLVPAGAQGNPYDDDAYALRRIVDGGPRARDAKNQAFSVTGGFEYDLGGSHQLAGYYQNSWVDQLQLGVSGQISTSALRAAVADGTFRLDQLNSQEVIDSISVVTFRDGALNESIWNLGLNGLIDLSGLDLGYAFGAEIRDETYTDKTDIAQLSGDIAGGAASDGEGDRSSKAVYGELSLSPFEMLELSVAGRYDSIEAAGNDLGSEFTYKVAGSLRPVEPLLIRASYGTGFKAPALGELFLGQSFGVTRAVDTTLCQNVTADPTSTQEQIDAACRTREIRSRSGGNLDLTPETSKALAIGAVVEPTPDIRFSADYWNIKVKDKIGSLTVQEILNNEAIYPNLVNRIGGQLSSPDSFVLSNLQNLTREDAQGVDFVATFTPMLGEGELIFDLRASYLIEFNRQSSAIQPLCDDAGTTSEPEWRGNGRIGYSTGAFDGNVTARYVGETTDLIGGRVNGGCEAQTRVADVDDYLEFGLNFGWQASEEMELRLGVNNVFDAKPPVSEIAAGGWPWYDQALYTNFGRYFYVQANMDF